MPDWSYIPKDEMKFMQDVWASEDARARAREREFVRHWVKDCEAIAVFTNEEGNDVPVDELPAEDPVEDLPVIRGGEGGATAAEFSGNITITGGDTTGSAPTPVPHEQEAQESKIQFLRSDEVRKKEIVRLSLFPASGLQVGRFQRIMANRTGHLNIDDEFESRDEIRIHRGRSFQRVTMPAILWKWNYGGKVASLEPEVVFYSRNESSALELHALCTEPKGWKSDVMVRHAEKCPPFYVHKYEPCEDSYLLDLINEDPEAASVLFAKVRKAWAAYCEGPTETWIQNP